MVEREKNVQREVNVGDSMGTVKVRPGQEIISLEVHDEVPVFMHSSGRGRGGGRGGRKVGLNTTVPHTERSAQLRDKLNKYVRQTPGGRKDVYLASDEGADQRTSSILNKKLAKQEGREKELLFRLAKGEVLQTEQTGFIEYEEGESAADLTQEHLENSVAVGVARKRFSLDLPYGPYKCSFTRTGRQILAGGRKGHVAFMECENMSLRAEAHVGQTIRAVQTLHNDQMFAVAQKKYVSIYDGEGTELHCLRPFSCIKSMDFLPYHYLLVTVSDSPFMIRYTDISTGEQVCDLKITSPAFCARHNPSNGVLHTGNGYGHVHLWTPNMPEPVVDLFAHNGPVNAVAVRDNYMVTGGAEGMWKIWDLRTYRELHYGRLAGGVTDIDISATGLVAVSNGSFVRVWKDCLGVATPKEYIAEKYPLRYVSSLRFRPFEDILAVGHTAGFGTLIVPGAGFANFDSSEATPFETKRQREEKEVKSLLDKLQPDSIVLDPQRIGNYDEEQEKFYKEKVAERRAEKEAEEDAKRKKKKKKRGKGKIGRKLATEKIIKGKRKRKQMQDERNGTADAGEDEDDGDGDVEGKEQGQEEERRKVSGLGGALSRFYAKRKKTR